jgi:hypothetical protein
MTDIHYSCMHLTPRYGVYTILLILLTVIFSLGCMATPAYPPPNGSSSVWIEYLRTGGAESVNDHLILYENLSATATRRDIASGNITTPFMVNGTTATDLNTRFAQANFLQLKAFYPAPYEGATYYTYMISYRGHAVQTEDTGIPPELVPIIDALNRLQEQGCGGDTCPVP